MTAGLAAVLLAGSVPGAVFAQNGRDDRGDRRGNQSGRRDPVWDKDNRGNRDIFGELKQWGRQDNRDNRDDRDNNKNREQWDNRGTWNPRDNRDNRNDRDNRDDWQYRGNQEDQKRQKTKNDWRNLATAAGGVAAIGILRKDPRIIFAGVAGALYSLNRYEQDRKSQSQSDRLRASFFSQPSFYRDGQRYDRREISQNGERFYRFERN